MSKYLSALSFVLFGDREFLIKCLRKEITYGKRLTPYNIVSACRRDSGRAALFWWRLASEMHRSASTYRQRIAAGALHQKYARKYRHSIDLNARIGCGARLLDGPKAIAIHGDVVIGENVTLRYNTSILPVYGEDTTHPLKIGNNVDIGAHTRIRGINAHIGDNVKIDEGSYIFKPIPSRY